jgi:two-component system chemotaxis sensor kinase CheA
MQSIEEKIENLAESLVLLDNNDLPALAALQSQLESLAGTIWREYPPLAGVCRKCAAITTKMILGEFKQDPSSAIKILEQGIAGMQAVVRDHRPISDVVFPAELQVESTPPPTSPAPTPAPKVVASIPPTAAKLSTPPETQNQPKLTMQFAGADASLVGEFITEAEDHCRTAEQKMMELETGTDNDANINAIFRSFHTIKGAAGFLELHPVGVLAHESETLLDLARKGTIAIQGKIADVIFASIDGLRKLLKAAEEGLRTGGEVDGSEIVIGLVQDLKAIIADPEAASDSMPERVGDILIDMGATTQAEIEKALTHKESPVERIGETLVKQGVVDAQAVAHALRDQRLAQREPVASPSAVKEIVKIDTERLDKLVDTIGELVIAESMVGHDEEFLSLAPPRIAKNVSHLNKITRELQEMGMSMRLVPVRATFQKLARAVRDLTRKSGKKVELIMTGEDAEVDRSIIENIGDPLMHMIRNAVDHAIESPDERIAAGKSDTGHVWLRAYHRGGNIQFEIEDDGRGLDTDRILAKAREKGLLDTTRELTEREIFNLVLLPGFSTAKQVTDISGRGVGMDVVKKNIDAMRGHLEIESARGRGSKFTMKLPLTLAMIDGMLIRVAHERYIIPTMSVVESINLSSEQIFTIRGVQEMINLRGSMLPILRLDELFELAADTNSKNRVVVVVEDNESRVGLIADELIGQRQTVIKSLGRLFAKQKWVSGGAILSDGTVGLILDINGLIGLAETLGRRIQVRPINHTGDESRESDIDFSHPGESQASERQAVVR